MTYAPAIVVVAFNRRRSLGRLLKALDNAEYHAETPLVISIDHGEDNQDVLTLAREFEWVHGEKQVIYRDENLGLRAHVLACGKLTRTYGSIVLLEDDLYVSPLFYQYAAQALEYYAQEPAVSGISLYHHHLNETSSFPFLPFLDTSDVFFLQLASSWGQAWTDRQWSEFETWYNGRHTSDGDRDLLPPNVRNWPESSWKKYFNQFLIERDKYFVYPRKSLSTNFAGSKGTHIKGGTNFYQVPLLFTGTKQNGFRFQNLEVAVAVYDAYCEMLPKKIKSLNPLLAEFDFETDLYGTKPLEAIQRPYMLTLKKSSQPLLSFEDTLKPFEMNVICGLKGHRFRLTETRHCRRSRFPLLTHYGFLFRYFYREITLPAIVFLFLHTLFRKSKS